MTIIIIQCHDYQTCALVEFLFSEDGCLNGCNGCNAEVNKCLELNFKNVDTNL